MQTVSENVTFYFDVPIKEKNIIKAFEGLMQTFKIKNKSENLSKNDNRDEKRNLLDLAGAFNGCFMDNISHKEIRENRLNKKE